METVCDRPHMMLIRSSMSRPESKSVRKQPVPMPIDRPGPQPAPSLPINRARVRAAARVGLGLVRSGVDVGEASAIAADSREVPESERVAVRVDVERLVLAGEDA